MAGWSKEKRNRVERAFYQFLDNCYIDSKDAGRISLGENLYYGQIRAITEIFDALEVDIHKVFFLKSRQLGISTIVRAVTTFMLGSLSGLAGALVFDTAPNRENARKDLVAMIKALPTRLKFPKVKGAGEGNREGLSLDNNSKILFMSAGVKKSASSGTLGRSVGLAFATLSELCSYDNDEGLESFEQSLSDINPDRLYIYESTARGYNSWHEMWTEARKDPAHCRCVFLGWWSKPSQQISADDPDFERYGLQLPTDKELDKIRQVKERYGFAISQCQLAWIRRKYDPTAGADGDEEEVEFEGSSVRVQEQPWTEDEAFQNTGSQFFPAEQLNEQSRRNVSQKYQSFIFTPGIEFAHMLISGSPNPKSTEFKVWEEPDEDGVYCFGVDPAFGENEDNDRSSIEVLRCYADGVDQVAEFASPLPTPQQLAWILASLMGWYGSAGPRVDCRYILELNGPGNAVFNEIKQLKFQLDRGYWPKGIHEKGIKNIFQNVRTYIYARPDGMTAGNNYHFKTNLQLKIMIMNHLRDYTGTGLFRVRSDELVEEMRSITQEGDTIKAPGGKKDDRVLSAAMATYYWQSSIRKNLITSNRTREVEAAKRSRSIIDSMTLFNQNKLQSFFEGKKRSRVAQHNQEVKTRWRYR